MSLPRYSTLRPRGGSDTTVGHPQVYYGRLTYLGTEYTRSQSDSTRRSSVTITVQVCPSKGEDDSGSFFVGFRVVDSSRIVKRLRISW